MLQSGFSIFEYALNINSSNQSSQTGQLGSFIINMICTQAKYSLTLMLLEKI